MSDDFGLRALQAAQFLADLLGWDCEAFKPMAQRDEWWHAMRSRAQELLSGFERTDALTAVSELADGRRLDRELRERLQRAVTRLQAEAEERRRIGEARHLAPVEDQSERASPTANAAPAELALATLSGEPATDFIFARNGEFWFIRAFGEEGNFKNRKGFEYIAKLLQRPGRPVLMAYLTGPVGARDTMTAADAEAHGLTAGMGSQPLVDKRP